MYHHHKLLDQIYFRELKKIHFQIKCEVGIVLDEYKLNQIW
jgi:hypothetical protein